MSPVRHEVRDRVAYVTLDRPDAMNAVTVELARALADTVRTLGDRDDVTVVLIRGAGGNFCAGGDFAEVERLRAEGADALAELFEAFGAATRAVEEAAVPVVAAVEGVAMAGGFELAQACDVVLARDDARVSDNHVNFGMIPGGGGSQRLARLVGRSRALAHLLSGERLSGRQLVDWGIALHSYPADTFDADVDAFVARLAGRSREALVSIKHLVRGGLEHPLADGLAAERAAVVRHIVEGSGARGAAAFAGRGENR